MLAGVIFYYERRVGIHSSGLMFLFWMAMVLYGAFRLLLLSIVAHESVRTFFFSFLPTHSPLFLPLPLLFLPLPLLFLPLSLFSSCPSHYSSCPSHSSLPAPPTSLPAPPTLLFLPLLLLLPLLLFSSCPYYFSLYSSYMYFFFLCLFPSLPLVLPLPLFP